MVKRVVWIERQSKGVTGERRCRGPVIPEEIDSTAGLVPGPGSAGLYALGRLGGLRWQPFAEVIITSLTQFT
jgi:hypothetical protein